MFEWLLVLCLACHFILFPDDAKYWMPGIIPFNKCVCNFHHIRVVSSVLWTWRTIKWFSRPSEVTERWYVFTRIMAENDRSLTALVAGMTRRIFSDTMTWAQKYSLLHLTIAKTPPVLLHCQSTWEPPSAPLTSPFWSNL